MFVRWFQSVYKLGETKAWPPIIGATHAGIAEWKVMRSSSA